MRTLILAPLISASRAFRITNLLSSIQQSEYSNALMNLFFKGSPTLLFGKSIAFVPSRKSLPPKLSYRNNPSLINQEGRRPFNHGINIFNTFEVGVSTSKRIFLWYGNTKRIGQEICGIALRSISRSIKASRTRRTFQYSRYRRPPWNNLVDADDVADAKSFISANSTLNPLPTASLAIPQPLIPPPITKISTSISLSL